MKSLNIDEFNTYLYCGELFRQYLINDDYLVKTKTPIEELCLSFFRIILAHKFQHKKFPDENQILDILARGFSYIKEQGHSTMFANEINYFIRMIGEFIDMFKLADLERIPGPVQYFNQGISIDYITEFSVFQFSTAKNKRVLFVSEQPLRKYLKSIEFGLSTIALLNNYSLDMLNSNAYFININTKGTTIQEFELAKELNVESIKFFINSMLRSVSENIYIPIWRCQNTTCPFYKECTISNRL